MVELKIVEDCIFWRVIKTCLKKVIRMEKGPFKPFILQALLEQYKKYKLVSVNNQKIVQQLKIYLTKERNWSLGCCIQVL
jgi:hypothetical protein